MHNLIFYVNCSIIRIYGVINQVYKIQEEGNMEKAMNVSMMEKFGKKYPKVKSILEQVHASELIEQNEKEMIQDQLMCMISALQSTRYKLILGRWRGDNTYSGYREALSKQQKTLVDETIFTIMANGRTLNVYVDLPIAV